MLETQMCHLKRLKRKSTFSISILTYFLFSTLLALAHQFLFCEPTIWIFSLFSDLSFSSLGSVWASTCERSCPFLSLSLSLLFCFVGAKEAKDINNRSSYSLHLAMLGSQREFPYYNLLQDLNNVPKQQESRHFYFLLAGHAWFLYYMASSWVVGSLGSSFHLDDSLSHHAWST